MTAAPTWGAADEVYAEPPHQPPPPDDAGEFLSPAEQRERRIERETDWLEMRQEAVRRLAIRRELAAGGPPHDELFYTRSQLANLPKPVDLIAGTLPRHSIGLISGRDGSYKSFVAIDFALSIATGRAWQGRTTERAPVLYVVGEGAYGIPPRVRAWEEAWHEGQMIDDSMFVIRAAGLDMHAPGPAFDHLLEKVQADGFGLIILDTLRRVSGKADGNGSEMGQVMDSMDKLRRASADGTVLTVAHTGKDDRDTRGWSGIEDDCDFVWHAKRSEDYLALKCVKMKDGPDGHSYNLQAKVKQDSLIIEAAVAGGRTVVTETQAQIVRTLIEVFPDGASTTNLMKASGIPDTSFYRALAALKNRDAVVNVGTPTRPRYVLGDPDDAPATPTDTPTDGEPS